jgi:DNA-directed RNA polymerase subunit RPC12/RpoP
MRATKTCRRCGYEFTASPADTTVNCPACRRRTRTPDRSEFYAGKIAEAKGRGYAARAAGDVEAYEAAVADLRHWQAARGRAS